MPAAAASLGAVAACLVALGPSQLAVMLAASAGVLVWLAAIDLESGLLPNRIVLPATAVILVATSLVAPSEAAQRIAWCLATGGFLLLFALLRPSALGMGDVKLGLLIGALLGGQTMIALLLAFSAVTLVGVALVLRSGRRALARRLPLGPFFAAGAIAALLLAGPSSLA